GLLFCRHVLNRERRPASLRPPESRGRDPARGTGHTTRATRDLQARLHELRRLGRGLWHLDTIATATPHRDQRRVLRAGRGGPDRHLAPVPLLPPSDARNRRGRSPASPCNSVEIGDAQSDRDLILFAGKRLQRGPVVADLGFHDGAWPGADVQRRRTAPELLASVRREADQSVERTPCTILVVQVVPAQGQTDTGTDVVRDPRAER